MRHEQLPVVIDAYNHHIAGAAGIELSADRDVVRDVIVAVPVAGNRAWRRHAGEVGIFSHVDIKLRLAVEEHDLLAHGLLEVCCRSAASLHLARSDQPRRFRGSVLHRIFGEQHHSHFEYHQEQIKERRADETELDRGYPLILPGELREQSIAPPCWTLTHLQITPGAVVKQLPNAR